MTEASTNIPSRGASLAIEATCLEKAYGAGLGLLLSTTPVLTRAPALAGVSVSLPVGASLAVLGRNGAGKSTLLRLLAGTALPTRGSVHVNGRVGLLLDLGSGLIDEMTGQENLRASLRLLGVAGDALSRAESFVTEFAEIGSFLGESVRVYSQGMRLRLAYAIAIATQPQVLITDEVLAVGDEAFQRKCSRHMMDFVEGGGTLVLATHNLYLAEKLCQTALWLEHGKERAVGPARQVAKAYRDSLAGGWEQEPSGPRRPAHDATEGTRSLAVLSGLAGAKGEGEHVRVRFEDAWEIAVPPAQRAGPRSIDIDRPDGAVIARIQVGPGPGVLALSACSLLPGRYRLRLSAVDTSEPTARETLWLECVGARRELGSVFLRHRWRGSPANDSQETQWGS